MSVSERVTGLRRTCGAVLGAVALAAGVMLPAQAASNTLGTGQALSDDEFLVSPNGQHSLFVSYKVAINEGTVLTNPPGYPSCVDRPLVDMQKITTNGVGPDRNRLVMQDDGNLVQYSYGGGLNGPTFATNTYGPGHRLVLQDDRNLVVYNQAGRPVWQLGTVCNEMMTSDQFIGDPQDTQLKAGHFMQSPNRKLKLLMQGDGNLVLYSGSRALWNTRTSGHPGAFFRLQADGNLVVYSAAGRPLWSSGTSVPRGNAPAPGYGNPVTLMLQSDGNLVLYRIANSGRPDAALWATRTRA